MDGRVDITDAVLLNKAIAGAVELDTNARQNGDCKQDGELTLEDAVTLRSSWFTSSAACRSKKAYSVPNPIPKQRRFRENPPGTAFFCDTVCKISPFSA